MPKKLSIDFNLKQFLILADQALTENNDQVSEYQLIRWFETHTNDFFSVLPQPHRLYQKHFWLFYHLYQTQKIWIKQEIYLSISALSIYRVPASQRQGGITDYDPLSEFYLDLNNLYLTQQEVAEMQKQFWQRYLALQEKARAIQTLQLTDSRPLNLKLIKHQYQKLANQHHPDKGGDRLHFIAIKKAYKELCVLFSS